MVPYLSSLLLVLCVGQDSPLDTGVPSEARKRLGDMIGVPGARSRVAEDRAGKPVVGVSISRADATDPVIESLKVFRELEKLKLDGGHCGIGFVPD